MTNYPTTYRNHSATGAVYAGSGVEWAFCRVCGEVVSRRAGAVDWALSSADALADAGLALDDLPEIVCGCND